MSRKTPERSHLDGNMRTGPRRHEPCSRHGHQASAPCRGSTWDFQVSVHRLLFRWRAEGMYCQHIVPFRPLTSQQHPMPVDMKNDVNDRVAQELCDNPDIQRIAHYASSKSFYYLSRLLQVMFTLLASRICCCCTESLS